jgi:hypothetical protein
VRQPSRLDWAGLRVPAPSHDEASISAVSASVAGKGSPSLRPARRVGPSCGNQPRSLPVYVYRCSKRMGQAPGPAARACRWAGLGPGTASGYGSARLSGDLGGGEPRRIGRHGRPGGVVSARAGIPPLHRCLPVVPADLGTDTDLGRLWKRRRVLDDTNEDALVHNAPILSGLTAASIQGTQALGASAGGGSSPTRPPVSAPRRCASPPAASPCTRPLLWPLTTATAWSVRTATSAGRRWPTAGSASWR